MNESSSPDANSALKYLTDIAIAFDPVEGAVSFQPQSWTRIRNAIFSLQSPTPSSAGSERVECPECGTAVWVSLPQPVGSERAVAEKFRVALQHVLWIKDCGVDGLDGNGIFRNWPETERDAMYKTAQDALGAEDYAATLPAAPKDAPKDREEPK